MQYDRARALLRQNPNFTKRFKFDHVWPILKNMEKLTKYVNLSPPSNKRKSDSSQSDNPNPDLLIPASFAMLSFNVNLTNDDVSDAIGSSSYQRSIGVKKSKIEKKNVTTLFFNL